MKRAVSLGITCLFALLLVVLASYTLNLSAGEAPRKIRIIYTNDTLGNLESCGCGGNNQGGLARRATLISQLVKENKNSVIVESGNLSRTLPYLQVVADSYVRMKYDAVGVGKSDAQLADKFLHVAKTNKLLVLDAFLKPTEHAAPYVIKNVGGIRVGIYSFGLTPPPDDLSESEISRLKYGAYKAARDSSDVLIVLDQAGVITDEWIDKNKNRLGVPDIVIGGIANMGRSEGDIEGSVYVLPTSNQGRHLGVADIEITEKRISKVFCRRIVIEPPIAEEPKIAKLVKEAMHGEGIPGSVITINETPVDGSKPYYSVQLCKGCHLKEYLDWSKTDHARAIQTLALNKRLVAECLPCHSEQFRRTSSVNIPGDGIGGVECATCHIDSLPHGMERKKVEKKTKVDPNICLKCHTKERSAHYDEKTYFPRVSHTHE